MALMLSRQPWNGPIGCVRIGLIGGDLKVNPTLDEMKTSTLDFVYAGNRSRPLMIETVASEVDESIIKKAMKLAQRETLKIITAQLHLIDKQKSNALVEEAELEVELAKMRLKEQWKTQEISTTTLEDGEMEIEETKKKIQASVIDPSMRLKTAFTMPEGLKTFADSVWYVRQV
jgi:polyribonucleotide nucleotidyltransferase